MKEAVVVQAPPPVESTVRKPVESPLGSNPEQLQPFVVLIPGIGGDRTSMREIDLALKEEFGTDNVTTATAEISADKRDKQQLRKLANTIMELSPMRKVVVAMHSLGSTAWMRIQKIIEKTDHTFFHKPQVQDNLQFVKIGESGSSRGPISRIKYLWHVFGIGRQKDKRALYAFPPEGVEPSDVTTIYSRESNKKSGFAVESSAGAETNDAALIQKERSMKANNDAQLRAAIANNYLSRARNIGRARGKEMAVAVQTVLSGTSDRAAKKRRLKLGGISGIRTLMRALGSKPMKELRKLHAMGYKVYSLIPEFDRVVTAARSAKFYANKTVASAYSRIVEGAPHDGVGLQRRKWARAIRNTMGIESA